jgi:CarboxypepD_reg-like domain
MKLSQIYTTAFCLLILNTAYTQIQINGIVLDSATKQPIANLSVFNTTNNHSTITNEDGEFEINTVSLPFKLTFSHISYKKVQIDVKTTQLLKIFIPFTAINLSEVIVGNEAKAILEVAVQKAQKDTNQRYLGHAFYQKLSREGKQITGIQEIFFDVEWTQIGIKKWSAQKARYAQRDNVRKREANTVSICFAYAAVLSKGVKLPNYFRQRGNNYDYKIGSYSNKETDDEIVEIVCNPKNNNTPVTHQMRFFVKTKTDNIIKIIETATYPPIAKSFKNMIETYTINFRENKNGISVLENLMYQNDTGAAGLFGKKIIDSSILFLYEYDDNINTKNMTSTPIKDDLQLVRSMNYDPDFWQKNIVIKRTELEKFTIKDFENSKKFDCNFVIEKK